MLSGVDAYDSSNIQEKKTGVGLTMLCMPIIPTALKPVGLAASGGSPVVP
jgi:hypothetical protein